MQNPITIISAGMAGLACARRLARAGHTPLVLDKGRGIGGRIATRRVTLASGEISFDHGAQYLTARDPAFAAAIEALGGATALWHAGAAQPHLVGVPGMSSLPRAMAAGLDVRSNTLVTAIHASDCGWTIDTATGPLETQRLETQQLVLAVPAPQAAALLGPHHPLHARLAAVTMAPCLTLMAAFPAAHAPPFQTHTATDDHPIAWIAHNSGKPARSSSSSAWVAQASVAWSEHHLEDPPEVIAALMLPMLAEAIGIPPDAALHAAGHRWRYAHTTAPLGLPFLTSDDHRLHIGGDWCLGARIESAWRSGTAIADALLTS